MRSLVPSPLRRCQIYALLLLARLHAAQAAWPLAIRQLRFPALMHVTLDQGRSEAVQRDRIVAFKLWRFFGKCTFEVVEKAPNLFGELAVRVERSVVGVESVSQHQWQEQRRVHCQAGGGCAGA